MADWDEKFIAELEAARRLFNPKYVTAGKLCEMCEKNPVYPIDSYRYCKKCFDKWQGEYK